MTYVLRIATEEGRDLVVAALRTAADQRTRVARQAAGKVAEQKRTGKDVRSSAVKVTNLLAEADTLDSLAAELAATDAIALVTVTNTGALEFPPVDVEAAITEQQAANPDDGTSPAAQALAAAAGLTDAIVEDGVDTGAIGEDDPDSDDVEDVLG